MPDVLQMPLKPLDDIYSCAGLQISWDRLCSELEEGWISPCVSQKFFHGGDCYIRGMKYTIIKPCLSLHSTIIVSLKSVRYWILTVRYFCLSPASRGQEVQKQWYSLCDSESQIPECALLFMGFISGVG